MRRPHQAMTILVSFTNADGTYIISSWLVKSAIQVFIHSVLGSARESKVGKLSSDMFHRYAMAVRYIRLSATTTGYRHES